MLNLDPQSLLSLPLSKQAALIPLLAEWKARERKDRLESDLVAFTAHFFAERGDTFLPSEHHAQIASALKAVERGEIRNLLINMPPRYGKTELAVINWIAQTIARNPRAKFIHLSYSAELALDNSARARDLIKSEAFQALWPVQIKPDADSKAKWYTAEGGGLYATAAASAVTGFGAGLTASEENGLFGGAIIIDDPLKADDARSEIERRKVNERLNGTIKSRRNSRNTPIVIIMQRLHEDDMSGYVLANGMGEEFYHLNLKALRDDGTALWPLKHTVEELEAMRLHDRYTFASQYQQSPVPAEGAIYKLNWFARHLRLPEPAPKGPRTMVVHSWDTAYKPGTHNDPSCCTVWHVTPTLYYLAEVHHGKWEYPELRRRAFDLAEHQRPNAILIEDKASGQSLLQEFIAGTNYPVVPIKPDADKETRARTEAASVEAGRVSLPHDAPWLLAYESEITTFPFGKHDDMVDSTSQFLRYMREQGGDGNDAFRKMMERLYS